MTRYERRGHLNLTGARPVPGPLSKYVVRIYYRSEGGELLAFDTDRVSYRAADALVSQYRCAHYPGPGLGRSTDAVDAHKYRVDEERSLRWPDARLVVLPSQMNPSTGEAL